MIRFVLEKGALEGGRWANALTARSRCMLFAFVLFFCSLAAYSY